RVGGTRNIEIDVRVVAATNRNLRDAIRDGRFREDLFYRLDVLPIHLPALRERREDIPVLAKFYLDRFSRAFSRNFQEISPDALRMLESYDWPGNIRELKNVIERTCIMHDGPTLLPMHLPREINPPDTAVKAKSEAVLADLPLGLEAATDRYEKELIQAALEMTGNNVLQAAQILRIPRGTLRYKMARHGL
ncbi:sigma-54-dependent Fis family transcriptional regulator, partial [bacterium]|nr:sigma-54-dependent Fis family transcriptional regulator [bacterium]